MKIILCLGLDWWNRPPKTPYCRRSPQTSNPRGALHWRNGGNMDATAQPFAVLRVYFETQWRGTSLYVPSRYIHSIFKRRLQGWRWPDESFHPWVGKKHAANNQRTAKVHSPGINGLRYYVVRPEPGIGTHWLVGSQTATIFQRRFLFRRIWSLIDQLLWPTAPPKAQANYLGWCLPSPPPSLSAQKRKNEFIAALPLSPTLKSSASSIYPWQRVILSDSKRGQSTPLPLRGVTFSRCVANFRVAGW